MSHCFWTLTLNLVFQASQYIWWSFVPDFKVIVVGVNVLKHCMLLKESVCCFYFSVYSVTSAYWLYLRVQFLEVWGGFKAKPGGVLSFENRAVSLCSYKHGQWYRLSKGSNYRLSKGCLFFLVICLFFFWKLQGGPFDLPLRFMLHPGSHQCSVLQDEFNMCRSWKRGPPSAKQTPLLLVPCCRSCGQVSVFKGRCSSVFPSILHYACFYICLNVICCTFP